MWGSVLVLALLTASNPVRLGIALLVISRERPVQNLFAYWIGCLVGCIPAVVLPLTLLHVTPVFKPFAHDLATSYTVRDIRIGMGVVLLSIAALIGARGLARRRQRANLPTPGGNSSTLLMDSDKPNAISRLLGTQDAATDGESAIGRLVRRIRNAWDNGSLWVAFVIGLAFGGTEPDAGLLLVAIIVTSETTIGAQAAAAAVFIVAILSVVEITLVCYLAAPAKTQAVLQVLHDWALAHRWQIVVILCTVAGASLVFNGVGS